MPKGGTSISMQLVAIGIPDVNCPIPILGLAPSTVREAFNLRASGPPGIIDGSEQPKVSAQAEKKEETNSFEKMPVTNPFPTT